VKIVIDARTLRTSTGRYIERLIHYLQKIDNKNNYVILLKPKDFDDWQPSNPRFKKVICPYKEYPFAEQIDFKKQLESLHPDLVHFAMVQQPVWYNASPVVTTMQDLTTVRFRNPDKNKGKKVTFTGTVIQVIRGNGEDQFRVRVNNDYKKIIFVSYIPKSGENKILENDKVVVRGVSVGEISYKSTMGGKISIPGITAHSIEIK